MTQLTDKIIKAALPGCCLSDDDGSRNAGRLMLVVKPNRRKVWKFRDRQNGKDSTRVIGDYPALSLSQARGKARQIKEEPTLKRAAGTLEELLDAYRLSLGDRPSANGVRVLINTNRDDLYKKEARAVTPQEISALLRKGIERGATVSVNRFRAALSAAYNYAAKHDLSPLRPADAATFHITSNPVSIVPKMTQFEKARDRVLTDVELADYVLAIRARNDAVGSFLELALLTGQRLQQLYASVIDGETIVVTDTKGRTGKPKINRLPIISDWKDLPDKAFLATKLTLDTSRRAGNAALPEGATMLDVRRTVETRLMELRVSRDDRGALLSHGSGGIQAQHYERSELLDIKAAALKTWFDAVENIVVQNTPSVAQEEDFRE